MLTKLTIHRFKRFDDVEVDLGNPVVFIGPNNSGKTTALQAVALWEIGVKRWNEKRAGKGMPEKRPGVTINRRDLTAVPVSNAKLLWRDLHVRDVQKIQGTQQTRNILIGIEVEGVSEGHKWKCGLEFDYANPESFHCRPLRLSEEKSPQRMPIPDEAGNVNVSYLQPMSGIAANEFRLDPGAINVYLGEGRTAEVLRNLCYQVLIQEKGEQQWKELCHKIKDLFGVSLREPRYIPERGEVVMSYVESGTELDLSSAGRGLQQTLLLLAYLSLNTNAVLLIDEPDAHLEILRQRQIYQIMSETARANGSQIIAASHSEIVLNEAADRDVVIAFLGKPHRIDDRGHEVLKSLKEIGFEQYYQAEETGWVLYLEGSTDLAILQAFAETLSHPVVSKLERPFVHYVHNQPRRARAHFHGLKEAKSDLVGFLLCDRLESGTESTDNLHECQWTRREIENYLCQPATLQAYSKSLAEEISGGLLFEKSTVERHVKTMEECIKDFVPPAALRDEEDQWWKDTKASGDFLDRLFAEFFKRLELPNMMRKTNYHVLARHVPRDRIDNEVCQVLDRILAVAERASPQ